MIQYKIGKSNNPSVPLAVQEALSGLTKAKLILYFASKEKFVACTQTIHSLFPSSVTIGSSAYREIFKGGLLSDDIVILAIEEGIECYAGVLNDIDKYPIKYVNEVKHCIDQLSNTSNTVCMEYCVGTTNSEEKVLSTLNSILEEYQIPLFGGTSADSGEFKTTYVGLNGIVYTNSCVFALIKNLTGRIKIYKENIFKPTRHSFISTRVDLKNRIVHELDNKPAAQVVANALGVSVNKLSELFGTHPMGRIVGKDIYISANKYITEKQGIAYYSRIYRNSKLVILEPKDYKEELHATIQTIQSDFPKSSFSIVVNCVARTMLFEAEGFGDTFAKQLGAIGDFVGFACHGEQINNYHFNQTMVIAVFE